MPTETVNQPARLHLADAVAETRRVTASPDPLLQQLHTPKEMHAKNWQDVALAYFMIANGYAQKNDRHIDELKQSEQTHREARIAQLEGSCREYDRLNTEIKKRDAIIEQLKATIHLLTAR